MKIAEYMREMYHTQEKRSKRLAAPVRCDRDDAWLGSGFYFWDDLIDAVQWGVNSKKSTGYYEIYKANLRLENFLDTVFNEEHYKFWVQQIEKAADSIEKKTGIKPRLKDLNNYFKDRAAWRDDVTGILFQDLPHNDNQLKVSKFYYRKRIQAVVYDVAIITNFAFQLEGMSN